MSNGATNNLVHFDIIVSSTTEAVEFYDSLFPNWSFSGTAPKTIEPENPPNGAFIVGPVYKSVPYFEVDDADAVRKAVVAQQRDSASIKFFGTHPVLNKMAVVFEDPFGGWVGAVNKT